MIRIPRRRRALLEQEQHEADAALSQSVSGLHAEVLQLGAVRARTPKVEDLTRRFLRHQERNHFGPNMARIMGEPRS